MRGIWTGCGGEEDNLKKVVTGQRYAQTNQFVYLGGTITAEADMTAEIRRRMGAAWSAIRRYANVIYDQPTAIVPMTLKVRMPQAEVREALLYGCSMASSAPSTIDSFYGV